jgi:energy-coupling factor transporter ATP-binding protein EcfA2
VTKDAPAAPAAHAVALCKTYGTGQAAVHALAGITVAFDRGRFTAVMGPSGSGKSTLMHCMAGLDRPTSGHTFVGGLDIGALDALHGIPVQVITTGTARPIRPEAEFALLRTAQEALANVARHAQATRAGVTLSYLEHQVALDVRDDGKGFDAAQIGPAAASRGTANGNGGPPRASAAGSGASAAGSGARGGGFGLVAMRQRIESLTGTLQVESEPGGGTGISACVPAASAEALA